MSNILGNLTIRYQNIQNILKIANILIDNKVLIFEDKQAIEKIDNDIILIDLYLHSLEFNPNENIIQKLKSNLKEFDKFCNNILSKIYTAFKTAIKK